ncbi:GAF and ANTAR domain-containing protein [Micromonospora robiginosa]|uniref:GAF and ANTAR domain-containing protein n=1 Tax=Micromonospora robiginosa TaxID=2749844 RepID=A0A7L6B3A9_9ACTN|nr:GAF and ANTAR domain-containing protein [Micromonospora ferruginea]QLQ36407.2 GAF and ANTAR domain-containing protein [Micromonospora ferruginea]
MGDGDRHARGRPSTAYGGAELDRLGLVLVDLARGLQSEKDERSTLDAVVRAAVDTIPGADYAAISEIRGRRRISTTATTHQVPCDVDEVQYDTDQGPCLSSLYEETTVRVSDVGADPRWPAFSKGVAELGIGSMLSFQLYVSDDNLGALNLYAERPDAFTDDSEQVGLLFAAHAAVAMSDARQITQLTQALSTRDVIGQAKGILMERHRVTGEQAFRLLVLSSQHTNTKLLDVARHLVESGELTAPR